MYSPTTFQVFRDQNLCHTYMDVCATGAIFRSICWIESGSHAVPIVISPQFTCTFRLAYSPYAEPIRRAACRLRRRLVLPPLEKLPLCRGPTTPTNAILGASPIQRESRCQACP